MRTSSLLALALVSGCSSATPDIRRDPPPSWASGIPCACGTRAACEAKCNGGASPSDCGSFSGCLLAGSVEVGVDVVEGRRVAKLACDKDDVLGCCNLGEAELFDGDTARAQVSWAKAFRLASAECDRGVGEGCYMAGSLSREGKGTTRDEARAAALTDRACALGHRISCLLR